MALKSSPVSAGQDARAQQYNDLRDDVLGSHHREPEGTKIANEDIDENTKISQSKLDSPPVGAVLPYAGLSAPSGYLLCDGQEVSRTTYADLFALIGTTYGPGNGSTTFNLPNLKGKVPVGKDASQVEFDSLGKSGGEKEHTLTEDEMPAHSHSSPFAWGHDGTGQGSGWAQGQQSGIVPPNTQSAGGSQPHNNLQPYLTINFIIKY